MFKFVKNIFFFFVLSFICFTYSFNTLQQAYQYSLAHEEFPISDNLDVDNFKYNSFYRSLETNFFKRLFFSIIGKPYFDVYQFFDFLKQIKIYRTEKNNRIQFLSVKPDSKIYLWGNIHGAMHSLIRDLMYLNSQKIIDDNFKINDNNTYFIFNGNLIDLGPYSMEVLALVLKLMLINKDKVFYIKGNHENKQNWHNYSLRDELEIRARKISDEPIPLNTILSDFFDTLPYILFVNLDNKEEYISISYYGPPEKSLEELICENNLNKESCKLPTIKAFIKGEDSVTTTSPLVYSIYDIKSYSYGEGLYRLSNIKNNICWKTVSSPILTYRIKYDFFYDSFCKIHIKDNFESSTITVYFNKEKNLDFQQGNTSNIVTGETLIKGKYHRIGVKISSDRLKYFDERVFLNKINFISGKIKYLHQKLDLYKKEIKEKFPNLVFTKKNIPMLDFEVPVISKLIKGEDLSQDETIEVLKILVKTFDGAVEEFMEIESLLNRLNIDQTDKKIEQSLDFQDEILLGSSLDLSKSIKNVGIPMKTGVSLKIRSINEFGGIDGKSIRVVFLDDKYIPAVSKENIERLINEYGTNLLLFPMGTPTLESSLDLIKEKKIFVFFPGSAASIFRDPSLTSIIHYKVSYTDEGRILTNYILKNTTAKNFLFFFQNDHFGKSVLQGGQEALKKNGIEKWSEVSYEQNASYFKDIVEEIKKINPEAIGFFSTSAAAVRIIQELGVEFLSNKRLFAVSVVADDTILKLLKHRGLSIIFAQSVPDPVNSNLEIVKEYRTELNKYGLTPNIFSLEGYIVASILVDQIKKIKGKITGPKIIEEFEKLKNYNFKGLNLNFDPKARCINKLVWIKLPDGKVIEQNIEDNI